MHTTAKVHLTLYYVSLNLMSSSKALETSLVSQLGEGQQISVAQSLWRWYLVAHQEDLLSINLSPIDASTFRVMGN